MNALKSLSLLAAICLITACTAKNTSNTSSPGQDENIIGGTKLTGTEDIAKSTVAVVDLTNSVICSGVLISDKAVLTAPYCMLSENVYVIFGKDTLATMMAKHNWNEIVLKRKVVKKFIPDTYNIDDEKVGAIGIAILAEKAPLEFSPITAADESVSLKDNDKLQVAGFGVDKEGELYQTDLTVSNANFSSTTFLTTHGKTSSTCDGDGGAPIYKVVDGKNILVGLLAYKHDPSNAKDDRQCELTSVVTRVSAYKSWLTKNLQPQK